MDESSKPPKKKKKLTKLSEKAQFDERTLINEEPMEIDVATADEEATAQFLKSFKKKQLRSKSSKPSSEEIAEGECMQSDMIAADESSKTGTEEPLMNNSKDEPDMIGGFTVMPDTTTKTVKKVYRKLPEWLDAPTIVEADIANEKVTVDEKISYLSKNMKQRMRRKGITYLFPVQRQLIPAIVNGISPELFGGANGIPPRDICCSAPTGSGKTLAFVLPIVQILERRIVPKIRALVVLPVTNLAIQVYKVFLDYTEDSKLKVGLTVGRTNFETEQSLLIEKTEFRLESLVDILVTTPGRLIDHISNTEGLDFSELRFLILDEADRMLEDTIEWLVKVESAVYRNGREPMGPLTAHNAFRMKIPLQKLLFSATLTQNPEKLESLNLLAPQLFTSITEKSITISSEIEDKKHFVGKITTPDSLEEYYIETVTSQTKPLSLLYMLHVKKLRRVLCFTGSQDTTNRLYHLLKLYGDLNVEQLSSSVTQNKRERILQRFAEGIVDVIVTTDITTRGIDLRNVEAVISYDIPKYLKTYVHRIGRTARAGENGTAYTIIDKNQRGHFHKMMKTAGKKVRCKEVKWKHLKPLREKFEKALKELSTIFR